MLNLDAFEPTNDITCVFPLINFGYISKIKNYFV